MTKPVQNNDDINTIIDVLDRAMMSEDNRIQDALKRLMVTSALVDTTQTQDRKLGPLRELSRETQHLRQRITNLEHEMQQLQRHLRQIRLVPEDTVRLSPFTDFSGDAHDLVQIDINSIAAMSGTGRKP